MERAVIEVTVEGPDPADGVTVLLAANPGSPPLPLAKVASGGELARAMLALRLVLTAGPPSLVFDEVDAGIGGAAALAVGRSLARLAATQQVFVVTHLPQVAAFADAHVQVSKETGEDHTVAHISELDEAARVVELTRMLSGQPESRTGREHAEDDPRDDGGGRALKDQARDRAACGAERHPDPDLPRPLRDGVAEYAVDAEAREHERHHAEGTDDREREAAAGRGPFHERRHP